LVVVPLQLLEVRQDGVGHGSRGKQIKKTNSIVNMMYGGAGRSLAFRLSPATSSIYILYIRPLQSSLKDFTPYIYFLSNNVL
jgi:hypothetical protein